MIMNILALKDALTQGDRRAIAQAMTLVESTHPEHQKKAQELLNLLLPLTGKSFRIGISGAPGVGKSTFIESFGNLLIQKDHRVAVLAIDPSSPLSKGSILADKTRMISLAQNTKAFIRPSPSGGNLGGTAQHTAAVIQIAEAAGFDIILIETVGVGQSEIAVNTLSDMVLLLLAPAMGDELQGLKKGIMEIADLILINKSDSGLEAQCLQTAQSYRAALEMNRPRLLSWRPKVEIISALEPSGLETVLEAVFNYQKLTQASGEWQNHRASQTQQWLESEIKKLFWEEFSSARKDDINASSAKIEKNKSTIYREAKKIIEKLQD